MFHSVDLLGNLQYSPYAGGSLDEIVLHYRYFSINYIKYSRVQYFQQITLEIWKKSTEKTNLQCI